MIHFRILHAKKYRVPSTHKYSVFHSIFYKKECRLKNLLFLPSFLRKSTGKAVPLFPPKSQNQNSNNYLQHISLFSYLRLQQAQKFDGRPTYNYCCKCSDHCGCWKQRRCFPSSSARNFSKMDWIQEVVQANSPETAVHFSRTQVFLGVKGKKRFLLHFESFKLRNFIFCTNY